MPRGCKKDKNDRLSQLSFETPACQLGSREIELGESPEVAVGRMARKKLGCKKKTS
jgi:hypothetical protein